MHSTPAWVAQDHIDIINPLFCELQSKLRERFTNCENTQYSLWMQIWSCMQQLLVLFFRHQEEHPACFRLNAPGYAGCKDTIHFLRRPSWTTGKLVVICSLLFCITEDQWHVNSGLSWTVSAPAKGIAVPVERHGVLQTLICAPVVRPKRCPTSLNPALLPSWMVVRPSFTLLMMLLLSGSPTMGLNRIRKKKRRSGS